MISNSLTTNNWALLVHVTNLPFVVIWLISHIEGGGQMVSVLIGFTQPQLGRIFELVWTTRVQNYILAIKVTFNKCLNIFF